MANAPTITELPWEAEVLADDLKHGKATLGWKGDPDLELEIEYITSSRSGFDSNFGRYVREGEIVDWRYRVTITVNGRTQTVGRWAPNEMHMVLLDLVKMDPRTPGFRSSFDRAQEQMDKVHRENARQLREAQGEMAEHFFSVAHDRNNPRNVFRQVGGSDERTDRNITKDDD